MISPNFENCQIGVDYATGQILDLSESARDWIGATNVNKNLRELLIYMHPSWEELLPKEAFQCAFSTFLPIDSSSFGLFANIVPYKDRKLTVISFSSALAPHDSLKEAFLGDMLKNPKAIASTMIRLQKAENRLDSYLNNFPGIFFSQRLDLSFSYLSDGIRKLYPEDYKSLNLNGSIYLDKIVEQDREYFQSEISRNSKSTSTFTIKYRLRLDQSMQIIYVMDIRTPIKTSKGKLLGFDGVLLDVTRQAIAEHRLSNSVWREGLTTLTNGLVHDFSNLMAGIFSISELYHGMMEKDDPMKNGIGQIKKSSMQAQQLVRRIIDLHRENPTNRVVHDLRMLLKDQMDLLEIIIPKNTRIKTNFGTETLPALIEETGFRQVVLNLAINAKDAVGKNGEIRISIKKVSKGEPLVTGSKQIAKHSGAVLTLTDNGSGIDPKLKNQIFDPFFTTKENSGGSGFGLYNAKLFIEDHSGEINFFSQKGEGTTFYVFLPLVEKDSNESEKQKRKKVKKANKEFIKRRKKKI